jgi:uncharacterized coiled-coil protein SlyX
MTTDHLFMLTAGTCLSVGFMIGAVVPFHAAEPRPAVIAAPQYLEGDPRSQVTINSRLETQIAGHDEGLTALELRLDREQKRIDDLNKALGERDRRVDDLELRVRGMQHGLEERARAAQRKDGGP